MKRQSGREFGRVLVIDDEPVVRRVMSEVLARLGLDVIEAVDGVEGAVRLEQHPEVRLVLLDMTMPRLGGEAAFRRLRSISPGIPVLVMSSYTREHAQLRFADREHGVEFLQKPFPLSRLRSAVTELLGCPERE